MNRIDEILAMPYPRILVPGQDGFCAYIHGFPRCFAQGNTAAEAADNLERAAEAWVEAALEGGFELGPPPNWDAFRYEAKTGTHGALKGAVDADGLDAAAGAGAPSDPTAGSGQPGTDGTEPRAP